MLLWHRPASITMDKVILSQQNPAPMALKPHSINSLNNFIAGWYLQDPDGRGRIVEPQLRDPFRYDVEDKLFAELDDSRRRIEAMEMPSLDMAHTYTHPKEKK